MNILAYIFIGISLSVDAFSVALAIGTTNFNRKVYYFLPGMIGIFHFIMPVMGNYISLLFIKSLSNKANIIIGIIFMILAVEIYLSKDDQEILINSFITIIILSLTVSLDSLLVGVAIGLRNQNIYIAALLFSLISSLITFFGIYLGTKLKYKYQNIAKSIGIAILIVLSIKYLIS